MVRPHSTLPVFSMPVASLMRNCLGRSHGRGANSGKLTRSLEERHEVMAVYLGTVNHCFEQLLSPDVEGMERWQDLLQSGRLAGRWRRDS